MLSSFVADGGQVELFVVSACGEHWAIAQSRCLGLTGTDIHMYIHTSIRQHGSGVYVGMVVVVCML